jgi:hypothetical protein
LVITNSDACCKSSKRKEKNEDRTHLIRQFHPSIPDLRHPVSLLQVASQEHQLDQVLVVTTIEAIEIIASTVTGTGKATVRVTVIENGGIDMVVAAAAAAAAEAITMKEDESDQRVHVDLLDTNHTTSKDSLNPIGMIIGNVARLSCRRFNCINVQDLVYKRLITAHEIRKILEFQTCFLWNGLNICYTY